jgi:hypothetical protein
LAVLVSVLLGRLVMVVFGMKVVTVSDVRVVRRFLMVAGLVMLRGFFVVLRGMSVVFGGIPMMLGCRFVARHFALQSARSRSRKAPDNVSMKHLQGYS